jgi:hypothetical protein
VTIGWSSSCGGTGSASKVQLALISGDRSYLAQGRGVVGGTARGTLIPEPGAAAWPTGYLTQLATLYRTLSY